MVYTILRTFAQSSSLSSIDFVSFISRLRMTVAGGILLEGLYRLQEKVINSEAYYSDKGVMMAGSLCMLGTNIITSACVLRYGLWLAGPFVAMRMFRDPNTDAFRQS